MKEPENHFALYPMIVWASGTYDSPSKTYCSIIPALEFAAFSTFILVSPSCFISEYFTAGFYSSCWMSLWLFYFSVLYLCYTIPLFCKFSIAFSIFSMILYVHKLLESLLYSHSHLFSPSVVFKYLNLCSKYHFVVVYP